MRVLIVLILVLGACSDRGDDSEPPVPADELLCRGVAGQLTDDLEADLIGTWASDREIIDGRRELYDLRAHGVVRLILGPHDGDVESPPEGQDLPGTWSVSGDVLTVNDRDREIVVRTESVMLFSSDYDPVMWFRVECAGFGFEPRFSQDEERCVIGQCDDVDGLPSVCRDLHDYWGDASLCGVDDAVGLNKTREVFLEEPGFQSISTSGGFVCGITDASELECLPEISGLEPPIGQFIDVDVEGAAACAIAENGSLSCWGTERFGQQSPPTGAFTMVDVGELAACGVEEAGQIQCWGGQNSNGTSFEVEPPAGGDFVEVSVGSFEACARRHNGSVICWGELESPPGLFTQISVSDRRGCGARPDGTATCWGRTIDFDDATQISNQNDNVCVLTADGYARCLHERYNSDEEFVEIDAGFSNVCGLTTTGELICWGDVSFSDARVNL